MRKLHTAIIAMLLVTFAFFAGYAAEQVSPPSESAGSAKEDDRLPIYKEGWQFFLAPYLWIPGVHLDLSRQGRFRGSTTVVDLPW